MTIKRGEIIKAIAEIETFTDFNEAQMELYKEIIVRNSPLLLGYILQAVRVSGQQTALNAVLRDAGREEKFCSAVIDSLVRLSEDQ